MPVDLHTHSTASDGRLSPASLVASAREAGLSAIALTDHDTLEGVAEAQAAGQGLGVEVVPAVELSCELGRREVHLVGLFVTDGGRLGETLARLREARVARLAEMRERLRQRGLALEDADLPSSGSVGRPHLAAALVRRGYVRSVSEAFARHLGDGSAAYVPKMRLSVEEALELIREAGGLSVLAHPGPDQWIGEIHRFAELGVRGVEAWSPRQNREATRRILEACARYDLAPSGGSDCHGDPESPWIGTPRIETAVLDRFRSLHAANAT